MKLACPDQFHLQIDIYFYQNIMFLQVFRGQSAVTSDIYVY